MIKITDLCDDILGMVKLQHQLIKLEELQRKNYNEFVRNFKNRVEGDNEIRNDVIYNWKYQYNTFRFNNSIDRYNDINDYTKIYFGVKIIKKVIDDGYFLNQ